VGWEGGGGERGGVGKLEKIQHTVVPARKVVSEMQVLTSKTRRWFCDRNAQKLSKINQTKIKNATSI